MEELLTKAFEEGGIVAVLIIIVVVLWIQLTRNSVPKEGYEHLLKRVDAIDEDLSSGVIPSLQKLSEAQKLTQDALVEMRRIQDIQLFVAQGQHLQLGDPSLPILEKLNELIALLKSGEQVTGEDNQGKDE